MSEKRGADIITRKTLRKNVDNRGQATLGAPSIEIQECGCCIRAMEGVANKEKPCLDSLIMFAIKWLDTLPTCSVRCLSL